MASRVRGELRQYTIKYHPQEIIGDTTMAADRGSSNKNYEVPVYFISGSCDWTCPALSAEKYFQEINAPQKEMIFMEGCGHGSQYDLPEAFAGYVKYVLQEK